MAARCDPDTGLVQACQRGEREAFRRLYERCGERVYRLAARFAANPEDAEDLTQDIFLLLFERIGQFRGDSAFSTWLYRLAVNLCLTHHRKRMETDPLDAVEEGLSDGAKNPAEICASDELSQRIDAAVAALPEGLKVVFHLVTVGDCSYQQTAEILNLSVEAVRTRMMRARQELRSRLKDYIEA